MTGKYKYAIASNIQGSIDYVYMGSIDITDPMFDKIDAMGVYWLTKKIHLVLLRSTDFDTDAKDSNWEIMENIEGNLIFAS